MDGWNWDGQRKKEIVFWKSKEQEQRQEVAMTMVCWESREIALLGHDAGGYSEVR